MLVAKASALEIAEMFLPALLVTILTLVIVIPITMRKWISSISELILFMLILLLHSNRLKHELLSTMRRNVS